MLDPRRPLRGTLLLRGRPPILNREFAAVLQATSCCFHSEAHILSPNPSLGDCHFYHSMDLPRHGTVHGDWDLRGRFDEYIGNVPIKGRTMLDIGTASGFLTFEAERRGARVTSFDADSADRWQIGPGELRDTNYYLKMRNSYTLAYRALNSRAQSVYGDVYQIAASGIVAPHDVVLVAQILVHLRDPMTVIEQAATLAKETIIIAEGMFDSDEPIGRFLAGYVRYSYWHLSRGAYRVWLESLGFDIKTKNTSHYHCNASNSRHSVTTLVANRRPL